MPDFTDKLKPRYDGTATLQVERDASAINVHELTQHLLSRDGFLERQQKVLDVLKKNPLFNKDQTLNLSRPDRYKLGLARAKSFVRIGKKLGWTDEHVKMAEYLMDEMSPFHLHYTMFGTQASAPEQVDG